MKGSSHVQGQGKEEEGTDPWGNSGWQFGLTFLVIPLQTVFVISGSMVLFPTPLALLLGEGRLSPCWQGCQVELRLSSSSLPSRPADRVEVHHEGHGAPSADRPPALLRHPDVRYHRLGVLQREAAPRMLHEQFRCTPRLSPASSLLLPSGHWSFQGLNERQLGKVCSILTLQREPETSWSADFLRPNQPRLNIPVEIAKLITS